MWLAFINVILNITLNLILIPRWSFLGASIATVTTEGLGCIFAFLYNIRYFKIPLFSKGYFNFIKLLLASGVMVLVIYLIPSTHIIITILLGGIGYTVALLLFRWFDHTDINLFKQALEPKR